MNKRDKYEEEKIKKNNRKEKEDKKEKEKERKREAYLKEKEEEIRNRKINIDYKKKKEKKKEEEEEEGNEEDDNEYEEIEEEEEEESSNKREEKNKNIGKEKYDKHIEKNYLGHKGITKRTIGIGRLNVKVYENDDDDSWLDDVVKKEKKEKKEKREHKKAEIIQNKNTENKNKKNNEIKNINNNKSNNNNNKEGKDSMIFNIDGKNFLIKISYEYSNNSGEGEIINVKFSTTSPGSKVVHWGLYKVNSPKIWVLPPKSSYPNFTKEVNNKALDTKFPNSHVNGQRTISFVLPRKLDGEYIGGIYFAIYDPIKNLWYNNFKKNFNLKFN